MRTTSKRNREEAGVAAEDVDGEVAGDGDAAGNSSDAADGDRVGTAATKAKRGTRRKSKERRVL